MPELSDIVWLENYGDMIMITPPSALSARVNDRNRGSYLVNARAADDIANKYFDAIQQYNLQGHAFYIFAANGAAVGFVGPDKFEYYVTVRRNFLSKNPHTHTELPVLETYHPGFKREDIGLTVS